MIRKLRYKFIAVTMLCIGALFLLILLVINVFMTVSSRNRGYEMLRRFTDEIEAPNVPPENAVPAPPPPANYQDALRVFSIEYDAQGNVVTVNYNRDSDFSEEDILQIGERALLQSRDSDDVRGVIDGHYLYLGRQTAEGRQFFFLDYSVEYSMIFSLFLLCLAAGLAGIVLLFLAVLFLSRWMIRPVETAFEKQKQFIADASHELKTPLTILSANAEVLSSSLGENRWLAHILEQVARMNSLIRDLLDLARMDAAQKSIPMCSFDLSRAAASCALSFESLAYESEKTYRIDIPEGIFFHGEESSIRRLVTILLDNAFKYADEKGTVIAVSDGSGITWNSAPDREDVSGSEASPDPEASSDQQAESVSGQIASWVLNQNTMKFHTPDCSSVTQMKEENRIYFEGTREEVMEMGYTPCGQCEP